MIVTIYNLKRLIFGSSLLSLPGFKPVRPFSSASKEGLFGLAVIPYKDAFNKIAADTEKKNKKKMKQEAKDWDKNKQRLISEYGYTESLLFGLTPWLIAEELEKLDKAPHSVPTASFTLGYNRPGLEVRENIALNQVKALLELRDAEAVQEAMSKVPILRTANAGIRANLEEQLGNKEAAKAAKLEAGIGALADTADVVFGYRSPISLATTYVGDWAGRYIGDRYFDSPNAGGFIGAMAGSFVPGMVQAGYRALAPKSRLLAREMNKTMGYPTETEFLPYNGVYDNGLDSNLVILSFNPDGFSEVRFRPATLSFAEKLGIPKGERNNFNRFLKEALEDLENYINSGQYRLTLYINPETRLISYEPKEGYVKLTPELVEGKESFTISLEGRGTYDINFKEGIPHVGISEHKNLLWIPEFGQTLGEVELFGGRYAPYNFRLTAPRTDAINLITESPEETLLKTKLIDEASPRINKEVMKDFWIGVSEAMRPSSYLSADAGKSPLGYTLINMFEHRNKPLLTAGNYGNMINKGSFTWEDIVNAAINKTKWESRKNGLSTDSYLALLKQAAREGSPYELRYSPDGFTVFNDLSIDNKFISDLLVQAQKGEIPKEKFLEEFHKWVEPYGGMDAKIVNGEIIIPHPFLYKRKLGGKLIPKGKKGIHIKKENKGKFTEYCGGKVTNECILKGKNSPDPKIRKRATFACNVRKWNKKK